MRKEQEEMERKWRNIEEEKSLWTAEENQIYIGIDPLISDPLIPQLLAT